MTVVHDIITRLKAGAGGPKEVAGATGIAALTKPPPRNQRPKAFVVLPAETAQSQSMPGATRSKVVRQISIFTFHDATADPDGMKAAESIQVYRDEVIDQLLGWQPAGHGPLLYTGFALVRLNDGDLYVVSEMRFSTDEQIRKL